MLFDNDGVLVDSEGAVDVSWRQFITEAGLDHAVVMENSTGRRAEEILRPWFDGDDLVAALDRAEELELSLASETEAMPGAAALLAALPPGRFTVCTSATRRLAAARWAGAGLTLPERVVTADDVADGKPAPDPYLAGARSLGVDPAHCVVFEDADAGGRAALAAGCRVVAVGALPWTVDPVARIPDLASVSVDVDGDDLVIRLG